MIKRFVKIAALCIIFILVAGASAYFTLTFIIKSEDTVIVPNLTGKDVVSALEILTDLQLNTKVNGSEYSRHFPKNHITFQEPESGSEIKKGRDVRVIISKGTRNILMPNLITLSEQQAHLIMDDNGISQGHLSHTYSKIIEKDHIISQVPSAGTMITRGALIDLLVSMGPQSVKYKMPDLSGLSLDEALLVIEKTNIVVGTIRSQFDQYKPRNSIIRQDPRAGYQVIKNSPVNLVINRTPGKTIKSPLHRSLYGSLLQYQTNNGFLKKWMRIELENPDMSTDIFDGYIKPGEQIWVLVPREKDAVVYIFENDQLVRTERYEAW